VTELAKHNRLVLVHGGGKEISRQMEKAGIAPRFVGAGALPMIKPWRSWNGVGRLESEIVAELRRLGAKSKVDRGRGYHAPQIRNGFSLDRADRDPIHLGLWRLNAGGSPQFPEFKAANAVSRPPGFDHR